MCRHETVTAVGVPPVKDERIEQVVSGRNTRRPGLYRLGCRAVPGRGRTVLGQTTERNDPLCGFDRPADGKLQVPGYRHGSGTANVWVTMPSGGERYLAFNEGMLIGSDPGKEMHQERSGDLNLSYIDGGERYELPDAALYGADEMSHKTGRTQERPAALPTTSTIPAQRSG